MAQDVAGTKMALKSAKAKTAMDATIRQQTSTAEEAATTTANNNNNCWR